MGRVNEQLCLLNQLVSARSGLRRVEPLAMRPQQVLRELGTGKGIPELFGVDEVDLELTNDFVRLFTEIGILLPGQRTRGLQHRTVSAVRSLVEFALVEQQLGFENLAFASRESKLSRRDDLAGAFTDSQIANRVLARIPQSE